MTDHPAQNYVQYVVAKGIADEVLSELQSALERFPMFNSAHEGYAILKEEVDELWDEVKNNKHGDASRQRKEAIQIAAMAIRFVLDVSDTGNHRNERYVEPEFRSGKTEFDPDGIPWGCATEIP